jgi:hypothetical protein
MKTLETIGMLTTSLVLWILFLIPRIIVYIIKFAKGILTIIENTINFIIEETLKQVF